MNYRLGFACLTLLAVAGCHTSENGGDTRQNGVKLEDAANKDQTAFGSPLPSPSPDTPPSAQSASPNGAFGMPN